MSYASLLTQQSFCLSSLNLLLCTHYGGYLITGHLLQSKLLFIKLDMEEIMVEPPIISRGDFDNTNLLLSDEFQCE